MTAFAKASANKSADKLLNACPPTCPPVLEQGGNFSGGGTTE